MIKMSSTKILSLLNIRKARFSPSRHLCSSTSNRFQNLKNRLCQYSIYRTYTSTTLPRGELKIPVPWGHVSAVTWGNPQDRRVLLVHGALDNADSFKRLIQRLPSTFYYVCMELPGHGLSSHFPQGLNLDFHNFVLSIHYVLNELNWKNCLYIGHSFGATLGVMYTILFPGRLEKIIALDGLMAMSCKPKEAVDRVRSIQEAAILSLTKTESKLYTKEEVLHRIQTGRLLPINKEAAEALFERSVTEVNGKYRINRDMRLRAFVGFYLDDEHNMEFLKHLKTPVLLFIVKESWYLLRGKGHLVDTWERKFKDFVTVVKVDGNHDVHNNNPEIIAPFVGKFFNSSELNCDSSCFSSKPKELEVPT